MLLYIHQILDKFETTTGIYLDSGLMVSESYRPMISVTGCFVNYNLMLSTICNHFFHYGVIFVSICNKPHHTDMYILHNYLVFWLDTINLLIPKTINQKILNHDTIPQWVNSKDVYRLIFPLFKRGGWTVSLPLMCHFFW